MRVVRLPARAAARVSAACLSAGVLVAVAGSVAQADREPTGPSADHVAQAVAAVADAGTQAAALDADLAMARATGAALTQTAAASDMAARSARLLLETSTHESDLAAVRATEAEALADAARLSLSLYAAQLYENGSASMGSLEAFFGGGGPQDVLDQASGLDAVSDEHARLLADADSARLLSATAQEAADEARSRQVSVAVAAEAAAVQAHADAATAQEQSHRLSVQQASLVAQLAALQQTSAALEEQRQSALAAAEEARRVDAAREAGLAAASQQTADDAARAQAALAAAQAAAQNARSARDAAVALAAQRAADAAAKAAQAAQAPPPVRAPTPTPTPSKPPTTPTTPPPPHPPPPTPPPPPSSGVPLNLANAAMWDRIAWCESRGNWHINTGNGYYGGLQFNMPTWLGVGGADFASRADLASREEQITVANRLYAQRGLAPWSCRGAA